MRKIIMPVLILVLTAVGISAGVSFIDNFEDSQYSIWTYNDKPINDDYEKIWQIKDGVFVSPLNNAGGVFQYTFRENVINPKDLEKEFSIVFDVTPLTYTYNNDFWLGLGLFSDKNNIQNNSIVFVLRKQYSTNISGLHCMFDRKWISQNNNFEFSGMNTYTISINMKKLSENKYRIHGNAKVKGCEDFGKTLFEEDIVLPDKTVFSGAFLGVYSDKADPARSYREIRGGFDNILMGTPSSVRTMDISLSSEKKSDLSLGLFNNKINFKTIEYYPDEISSIVNRIKVQNTNYAGYDKLSFLEMLSLRNLALWEEARKKTDFLAMNFPESPYTQKLGGANGKTEQDAAVEFSQALKLYHDHFFDDAKVAFDKYIKQYPENWRVERAYYTKLDCTYQQSNDPLFLEESNDVISKNLISTPFYEKILLQQAASFVRIKQGENARKLIDYLDTVWTRESQVDELKQLRLESYVHYEVPDIQTKKSITPLMNSCLDRSREINRWYKKNIKFYSTFFTEEPETFFIEEIEKVKGNKALCWQAIEEYLNYIYNGKKDSADALRLAEEIISMYPDESTKERQRIVDYAAQIYLEKGELEKFNQLKKADKNIDNNKENNEKRNSN